MAEPRAWWKGAFVWEAPLLAALAAFMLWVRLRPYAAMTANGRVFLFGSDSYYHYREVLGIVRSFPRIPRFDPWTFYPNGTPTNQFGTLFDWGAAAWIVMREGTGASETYVQQVVAAYPAYVGALIIVPFYYLAKRLVGTAGAIIASLTLAVLPGEFMVRGMASYMDHHVAEALMAVVMILGFLVAVDHGHAHRREIRDLHRPQQYWRVLAWGVVGGLAIGASLYTWPPALLFVAILALWHTIVVLLTNARGEDARGIAFSGAVAYLVGGLVMVPAIETYFFGDFNAYGILQVVAPIAAAAWILGVDLASRTAHARGWNAWALPGGIVVFTLFAYFVALAVAPGFTASIKWGLSWVTGIGVEDTMRTIGEAFPADFFCQADSGGNRCLNDYGILAPVTFLLLVALGIHTIWRRRPEDILLLLWSLVIFRATDTQIRFSYYLAINMALLLGWAASRLAAAIGLERDAAQAEAREEARAKSAAKAKGRKTRREAEREQGAKAWKVAAVGAILLLVLPGNVFPTSNARPGWVTTGAVFPEGYASDVVLWRPGLEWMRENTPTAGVDLGLVVDRPGAGERFDYPDETYGVLTWWDYGHYIETMALRPPVANPFQQAAPFASLYFTERDPARADAMLDEWVQGEGPIRYVAIDDEMATGKYGPITVWASSQNASRARWAGGEYIVQKSYETPEGPRTFRTTGPEYTESMMGRLYDADGNGLPNYRLVWEHPVYVPIGTIARPDGGIECLHDVINTYPCGRSLAGITSYQAGTAVPIDDAYGIDLGTFSRLKIFERVPGARLVGTAEPGAAVTARAIVNVERDGGAVRPFAHEVSAVAAPDGRFEIVFPYSNADPVPPEQGGTRGMTRVTSLEVYSGPHGVRIDVPDRAVLFGEEVEVRFGS